MGSRTTNRPSLLLLLLPLLVPALRAQDPAAARVVAPALFLERAYFSPLTPSGKDLLFEGRPAVHYFFYNALNDGAWQKGADTERKRWRFAAPASALFIVRMTDTTSQPVLTPSYRIRPIYLQAIRLTRDTSRKYFRMLGLATGAAHYSNGQKGCTYLGFTRLTPASQCAVSDPALANQRIANTLDGDFSTTYFSWRANWRRGELKGPFAPLLQQFTVGGEFQAHPFNLQPGGINEAQARQWGQHQWSVDAEWERRRFGKRLPGVFRVAGDFMQRFGGQVAKPLTATWIEVSYVLDRVEHVGLFARQHWGFDYYNINFQNRRPFFTFGFMWDLGRLDLLEAQSGDQ
jgi:hypothetical protein